MRIHLLTALVFLGAGCASSRGIAEGHYPTTVAAEQRAAIDAIVERWFDNALSHPDCRAVRNEIYSAQAQTIGAPESFARLRSPVVLVFSSPERLQERTDFEADGHGGAYPEEYHTLYRFGRARILYAKDSDYARIWPNNFQLSESARAARIPNEFVDPGSSYLLFANFIEYNDPPNLEGLVVCDLSNQATLSSILGQPTP